MRRKRRIEAELAVRFEREADAKAVLDALEPDNKFELDGLRVRGRSEGKKVVIDFRCERGVLSLINAIDDVLSCLGVAEGGVHSLKRLARKKGEKGRAESLAERSPRARRPAERH